jgi:GNAT superfamily N-acetyltransferase
VAIQKRRGPASTWAGVAHPWFRKLNVSPTSFQLNDNRVVELEWDDDEMIVWAMSPQRTEIGRFTFSHIEGASEYTADDYYLVTNMQLDHDYRRNGIGREIIRQVGEIYPVVFSPNDGNTRSDGSHLVEDGPQFATMMVAAGLAHWQHNDD